MSKLEEYVSVENAGVVATFTSCRIDPDGNALPVPVVVALVRFPLVHGGLIHRVKGPIAVGDTVRVVFKAKSDRTGSILDIDYFERV